MRYKSLTIFLSLLVIITAGLFLFSGKTAQAAQYACSDPEAKWNKDYNDWPNTQTQWTGNFHNFIKEWGHLTPAFSCESDSDYSTTYYTRVLQCGGSADESPLGCEGASDCENSCINGARCVRRADCETAGGGVCIKDGTSGAPEQDDIDCASGITKNTYTFKYKGKTYKNSKWRVVRFRCPAFNATTCWVPVEVPPVEEPPQEEVTLQKTTSTPKKAPVAAAITITDCCRNIVPKIDLANENYTLNHVVQTAINIYECILCIVGALILAMIIAGSVMIMISAGNDARVGLGKKIISSAVVGGLIVFFSFLIVNFTVKALGANFVSEPKVEINPQGPGQ